MLKVLKSSNRRSTPKFPFIKNRTSLYMIENRPRNIHTLLRYITFQSIMHCPGQNRQEDLSITSVRKSSPLFCKSMQGLIFFCLLPPSILPLSTISPMCQVTGILFASFFFPSTPSYLGQQIVQQIKMSQHIKMLTLSLRNTRSIRERYR